MRAKLIDTESIEWGIFQPHPGGFPCFVCGHRDATLRATLEADGNDKDGVTIKACICESCTGLVEAWAGSYCKPRLKGGKQNISP